MSTRFLELLDVESRERAVTAITNAISVAFLQDGSRETNNEIKHRFNICLGYVADMRSDLGWSWQRIHDTLPIALRSKLDGIEWAPPSNNAWVTDGNTGLILPPGIK